MVDLGYQAMCQILLKRESSETENVSNNLQTTL